MRFLKPGICFRMYAWKDSRKKPLIQLLIQTLRHYCVIPQEGFLNFEMEYNPTNFIKWVSIFYTRGSTIFKFKNAQRLAGNCALCAHVINRKIMCFDDVTIEFEPIICREQISLQSAHICNTLYFNKIDLEIRKLNKNYRFIFENQ